MVKYFMILFPLSNSAMVPFSLFTQSVKAFYFHSFSKMGI